MASLFEIALGASGLIGFLLRYIGPLAIAPTITLVGLSLFRAAASFAEKNWYIALVYVTCLQYLVNQCSIVHSEYSESVSVSPLASAGKP